jgi:hypothetical protein
MKRVYQKKKKKRNFLNNANGVPKLTVAASVVVV